MKKISYKDLSYIPASHENKHNPAVFKKILMTYRDIVDGGRIQMINWAKLVKGRSFALHYHQDMEEIFILISGKVSIKISNEEKTMEPGDCVIVRIEAPHQMENIGNSDAEYIVIGVSLAKGGMTKIGQLP